MMLFEALLHRGNVGFIPLAAETAARLRHKIAHRKRRTKGTVHTGHRVAHAHSVPGIAVIARTDCQEVGFVVRTAAANGSLHRHLHSHLHRHRA